MATAAASNVTHFDPAMDKAKALRLLQEARGYILSDRSTMICFAIGRAERELGLYGQAQYLSAWIEDMLHPCNTYSQWVLRNHPDLFKATPNREEAAKQGRLAWIDWMIKEVQS